MKIFDYNRVVKDLNGLSREAFLAALEGKFAVEAVGAASPPARREFGLYLGGHWYRLASRRPRSRRRPGDRAATSACCPTACSTPVLGIKDLRKDNASTSSAAYAAWGNWRSGSIAARWPRPSPCSPPAWKT